MSKDLSREIQRLEDVENISNLMSLNTYLLLFGRSLELQNSWAKQRADVSFVAEDFGYFDGPEGLKKFYGLGGKPGWEYAHLVTNPLIEVAADGRSAQGLFVSPGFITAAARASWCYRLYGANFVKEDGKWKFLRLHMYSGFHTLYNKSWVQSSLERGGEKVSALANFYNDRSPLEKVIDRTVPALEDESFSLNTPPKLLPLPQSYSSFEDITPYVALPGKK